MLAGLVVLRAVGVCSCYSLRIVLLSPECPSTFLANILLHVPAVPWSKFLGGLRGGAVGFVNVVTSALRRDPYGEAPHLYVCRLTNWPEMCDGGIVTIEALGPLPYLLQEV